MIVAPKQSLHQKKTCVELVCPTGDVFTLTANQTWYVVKELQEARLLLRVMAWNSSSGRGALSNHFDAFVSSDVYHEVRYACFSPLTFSPLTRTRPMLAQVMARPPAVEPADTSNKTDRATGEEESSRNVRRRQADPALQLATNQSGRRSLTSSQWQPPADPETKMLAMKVKDELDVHEPIMMHFVNFPPLSELLGPRDRNESGWVPITSFFDADEKQGEPQDEASPHEQKAPVLGGGGGGQSLVTKVIDWLKRVIYLAFPGRETQVLRLRLIRCLNTSQKWHLDTSILDAEKAHRRGFFFSWCLGGERALEYEDSKGFRQNMKLDIGDLSLVSYGTKHRGLSTKASHVGGVTLHGYVMYGRGSPESLLDRPCVLPYPIECLICGELVFDEEALITAACGHVNHRPCVLRGLLEQSGGAVFCPICKCDFHDEPCPSAVSPSITTPLPLPATTCPVGYQTTSHSPSTSSRPKCCCKSPREPMLAGCTTMSSRIT